jgi:hypothetical protein
MKREIVKQFHFSPFTSHLLSSEQNDEVCDATDDEQRTER